MKYSLRIEKNGHRNRNRHLIALLRKKSCDLSKARQLCNVFYAETDAAVASLKDLLQAHGFEIAGTNCDSTGKQKPRWIIEAELRLIPALELVNSMTDLCFEIAIEADADYDGWYTEV